MNTQFAPSGLTFERVAEDHPDVTLIDAQVRAHPPLAFRVFRDDVVDPLAESGVLIARSGMEVLGGALTVGATFHRLYVRSGFVGRRVGRALVEHAFATMATDETGGIFINMDESSRGFWERVLSAWHDFDMPDWDKIVVYPRGRGRPWPSPLSSVSSG